MEPPFFTHRITTLEARKVLMRHNGIGADRRVGAGVFIPPTAAE
jgi:hypothetical protein